MNRRPIICVDFDGVLHSYTSGWKGPRCIPDAPVAGAIEWLVSMTGPGENVAPMAYDIRVQLAIYSSRSRYIGGRRAMKKWLMKHGMTKYQIEEMQFPLMKPPAHYQLDDRAVTFTGTFPTVAEMLAFQPWNKKGGKR